MIMEKYFDKGDVLRYNRRKRYSGKDGILYYKGLCCDLFDKLADTHFDDDDVDEQVFHCIAARYLYDAEFIDLFTISPIYVTGKDYKWIEVLANEFRQHWSEMFEYYRDEDCNETFGEVFGNMLVVLQWFTERGVIINTHRELSGTEVV